MVHDNSKESYNPRKRHCFLACSGTSLDKSSEDAPFNSVNWRMTVEMNINLMKEHDQCTEKGRENGKQTLRFEVKERRQWTAIRKTSTRITKFIEKGVGTGLQLQKLKLYKLVKQKKIQRSLRYIITYDIGLVAVIRRPLKPIVLRRKQMTITYATKDTHSITPQIGRVLKKSWHKIHSFRRCSFVENLPAAEMRNQTI